MKKNKKKKNKSRSRGRRKRKEEGGGLRGERGSDRPPMGKREKRGGGGMNGIGRVGKKS